MRKTHFEMCSCLFSHLSRKRPTLKIYVWIPNFSQNVFFYQFLPQLAWLEVFSTNENERTEQGGTQPVIRLRSNHRAWLTFDLHPHHHYRVDQLKKRHLVYRNKLLGAHRWERHCTFRSPPCGCSLCCSSVGDCTLFLVDVLQHMFFCYCVLLFMEGGFQTNSFVAVRCLR